MNWRFHFVLRRYLTLSSWFQACIRLSASVISAMETFSHGPSTLTIFKSLLHSLSLFKSFSSYSLHTLIFFCCVIISLPSLPWMHGIPITSFFLLALPGHSKDTSQGFKYTSLKPLSNLLPFFFFATAITPSTSRFLPQYCSLDFGSLRMISSFKMH